MPEHQSAPLHIVAPGHAVSDAPVVEDVVRLLRVVAELAAELLDEDAHQVGVGVFPVAPDLAQQGDW